MILPSLADAIYLDFFLKCAVALLFGWVIGFERQTKGKPAGIKTHALICLGAMLLTFLSINISIFSDPSRIAAQIVSGIGFIGAGTIFMSKHRVQGLTSAATVWAASAVGMLVGAGFIWYSYIALSLIVTLFFLTTPKRTPNKMAYTLNVEVLDFEAVDKLSSLMDNHNLSIHHKTLQRDDSLHLTISYTALPITQHLFTKQLFEIDGLGHIIKI